jgi:hypothetical protein
MIDKYNKGSQFFKPKPKLSYQPVSKPTTKKKNNVTKRDVGADLKNQPTNDCSNLIGTSNDALKSDSGPNRVEEMVPTQHD